MSSEENKKKAQRGNNAKKALHKVVDELEKFGAIESRVLTPKYGYDNLSKDQFQAVEEVTLTTGEKYVLYSTSTVRNDRIKGLQWDVFNIKKIDENIEYAYVVIPDDYAFDQGTSVRDNIREGSVVSPIDDILTVDEFYDKVASFYGESLSKGIQTDLAGRKLEELFADVLSNEDNLRRYNQDQVALGYWFNWFEQIMNSISILPHAAEKIRATASVPKLLKGGSPKTDVIAEIRLVTGENRTVTFSLKNTSRRSVSVHEYTADAFADVLDVENLELRKALNAFQSAGSKREMAEGEAQKLEVELAKYKEKLNRWVFGGYGVEGVEECQCAQYLVAHDKNSNSIAIHQIDDYIEILEEQNIKSSGFGTIFSWTYPSKKRGMSIQLKAKIIF